MNEHVPPQDAGDPTDLASVFPTDVAGIAARVHRAQDNTAVLRGLVRVIGQEIPHAVSAAVTVFTAGQASTIAATDKRSVLLNDRQQSLGEGPSFEAAPVTRGDDLTTDTRWPGFAAAAAEAGLTSVLSFQLFAEDGTFGAVTLYGTSPFSAEDERIGTLLAAHASTALLSAFAEANLLTALESRDVIGQAKGILMERMKLTGDQAFDLLVATSQRSNRKLREIAEALALTGELRS